MKRESFYFYREWYDTARELPTATAKWEYIRAIIAYGLNHTTPEFSEPTAKAAFETALPLLENDWQAYERKQNRKK